MCEEPPEEVDELIKKWVHILHPDAPAHVDSMYV